MKGIIMELSSNSAVVMTTDGEFMNVPLDSNQFQCGEEIPVPLVNKVVLFNRKIQGTLSIAAVFLLLIVGSWLYYSPAGYVNIDINPSIELTYNRFDLIIKGRGLNLDGEQVIEGIESFKNKSIERVIEYLIIQAEEDHFIEKNQGAVVVITYTSLQAEEKINLPKLNRNGVLSDLEIIEYKATADEYDEAKSEGRSVGINKLIEKYEEELNIKFEEEQSVKEIMKKVKYLKSVDDKHIKDKDKNIEEDKSNTENVNSIEDVNSTEEVKDKGNKDKDKDKNDNGKIKLDTDENGGIEEKSKIKAPIKEEKNDIKIEKKEEKNENELKEKNKTEENKEDGNIEDSSTDEPQMIDGKTEKINVDHDTGDKNSVKEDVLESNDNEDVNNNTEDIADIIEKKPKENIKQNDIDSNKNDEKTQDLLKEGDDTKEPDVNQAVDSNGDDAIEEKEDNEDRQDNEEDTLDNDKEKATHNSEKTMILPMRRKKEDKMKKIISLMLVLLLTVMSTMVLFADNNGNGKSEDSNKYKEESSSSDDEDESDVDDEDESDEDDEDESDVDDEDESDVDDEDDEKIVADDEDEFDEDEEEETRKEKIKLGKENRKREKELEEMLEDDDDDVSNESIKKQIQDLKKESLKIRNEIRAEMRKYYTDADMEKLDALKLELESKFSDMTVLGVDSILSNSAAFKFDAPPVIKNGRTLIPVRAITEGFNAIVDWDGEQQKVTITKGDIVIELWLENSTVQVNGVEVVLDTEPELINDRTFVPLRFIAETLNLTVEWNEEDETVELIDEDVADETPADETPVDDTPAE